MDICERVVSIIHVGFDPNFFRKLQPPALAAPVEDGMMFWEAHRPPLQSCPVLPETVDVAG